MELWSGMCQGTTDLCFHYFHEKILQIQDNSWIHENLVACKNPIIIQYTPWWLCCTWTEIANRSEAQCVTNKIINCASVVDNHLVQACIEY